MRNVYSYLQVFCLHVFIACMFTAQLSGQDLERQGREYLTQNLEKLGLQSADLNNFLLTDKYSSPHNGLTHISWNQTFEGIPVQGAILNIHIDRQGKVWSMGNRFIADLAKRKSGVVNLSASEALAIALTKLELQESSVPEELSVSLSPSSKTLFDKGTLALEDISAELNYVQAGEQIRLAWKLLIYTQDAKHWWQIQVDAESGNVLGTSDLVLSCHFGDGHMATDGTELVLGGANLMYALPVKPQKITAPDSYRVYPLGIESPNHGGRTLEVNPADLTASPFGWHDTDGIAGAEFTTTRGNNVDAQDDQDGNNGTGFSPDGGIGLDFDFALDFSLPITQNTPTPNLSAATTNLFYWNNIIHDVMYQYGFDEASGNFQENNYGNGGIGGDYVLADAQDGSGANNATFGTPADGGNGRMQMFLWTGTPSVSEFEVNAPAGIAGMYNMTPSAFGQESYNLTADMAIVDDGSVDPSQGCNALTNGATIAGKIAVIDRGGCEFGTKALNAENAGAIGVIVVNNAGTGTLSMGPGADGAAVTIPAAMISLPNGNTLKAEITGGATVNSRMENVAGLLVDGDFDNGIIVHEYGHGISTRLTGGPGTSGCLGNIEQAGEGWSDFFALVMTHLPSYTATTPRGIGTYAIGQPTTGGGIRTYPYTRDMTVNPHTYDAIKNPGLSAPHGIGSVFAVMLYDLYWNMIDQYGFDPDLYAGTGGNNRAIQLVIDGLKLQPCSPGFVDMRDAILVADQANNAGANEDLIWRTFARRGLGYSALQGSSNDRSDGTEAFDLPPSVLPVELLEITAKPVENAILLSWATALEQNNRGFEVERFVESSQTFESIGWIDGKGDTDLGHPYHIRDKEVTVGELYTYRLKQIDFDGNFAYSDQVNARVDAVGNPTLLLYPNPLNVSELQVEILGLKLETNLTLEVFDHMGRKVFVEEVGKERAQGIFEINLADLASGVYSIRVQTPGFSKVEKLIIR